MKRGIIPDVYLQDEVYFEDYKDDIKQLFGGDIFLSDCVAIHVRRGDYVNNPFYVDLMKTDYYERAVAEFPGARFIVFSDDTEWCHKQEIFKNIPMSKNNEINDLNIMAGCKGIIIANSSYSWWAAYIAPNCGKVVAPSVDKWFTDGIERTKCPESWIRI
jgi:hypothetical protein